MQVPKVDSPERTKRHTHDFMLKMVKTRNKREREREGKGTKISLAALVFHWTDLRIPVNTELI